MGSFVQIAKGGWGSRVVGPDEADGARVRSCKAMDRWSSGFVGAGSGIGSPIQSGMIGRGGSGVGSVRPHGFLGFVRAKRGWAAGVFVHSDRTRSTVLGFVRAKRGAASHEPGHGRHLSVILREGGGSTGRGQRLWWFSGSFVQNGRGGRRGGMLGFVCAKTMLVGSFVRSISARRIVMTGLEPVIQGGGGDRRVRLSRMRFGFVCVSRCGWRDSAMGMSMTAFARYGGRRVPR